MGTGVRFVDQKKILPLLAGSAGATATLWVDLELYSHVAFLVVANNGTSVTGAAITINQAQDTAGTGSKALAFNNYFAASGGFAAQATSADAWSQVTGVSGTFTTATTASTRLAYLIEVHDTDLDLTAGFRTVALSIAAGAANTTFTVVAIATPRFGGNAAIMPSALS